MSGSCTLEGCAFDDTGVCALERDPLICSNRVTNSATGTITENVQDIQEVSSQPEPGAAVLEQPSQTRSFSSSRTLGLDDMNDLMGTKYVNLVGILGDPESGKTACLASLYLLISHAMLDGWTFANSRSLTGFEEIARGARDWNEGRVPEQMTVRTEIADDGPGFLHLKLVRNSDGLRVDLALPDVPGEWTQTLVNSGRSNQLDFMKSAEVIWIVLDGRTLAQIEKRQGLIARVGQLVGRLNTMLNNRIPRLILVVTHRDLHALGDDVTVRLQAELARRGCNADIVNVAPFSDNPENVRAGAGLAELIDLTVGKLAERPIFWPSTEPTEGNRVYLNYRRDQ